MFCPFHLTSWLWAFKPGRKESKPKERRAEFEMAAVIGWDTKGQPGAKGSIFEGEEMEQKITLSLAQVI